jgi:hypothetical protein
MINLTSNTKRLLIITIVGLMTVFSVSLHAQKSDLDFKITTISNNGQGLLTIELFIEGGTPSYKVYILDKEPWNGGKSIRNVENVTGTDIKITNLKTAKYYICIIDQTDKLAGKWYSIQ